MPKFPWSKKAWDKCMCSFELQEYGGGDSGKGWHSITEPTGTPISKQESKEYFKPDRHYRVIARALEGEQAGRFIGVVWDYYEPYRGLLKKGEEEKREKAPPKPKEPEEYLGEYADKVEKILAPIPRIFEVLDRIRGEFTPTPTRSEEGEETSYQIPPPQFDGKLPAIMHPYVVHVIAEEIKGVIDYGATRLGEAFGVGGLPGKPAPKEEEEEEEVIPSLAKFKEKKAAELPPEKEEEEMPTIPMSKKEEPEEAPSIEEKKEEAVVPSLEPYVEMQIEEEKPEAPKEEEEPLTEKVERRELEREFEPEEEGEEEMPSLPKKRRQRKKE